MAELGFHPGKDKKAETGACGHKRGTGWGLVFSPSGATYCILRMEDVRGRRIVHNDHFAQLPAQATQVFHVVPTMEDT